MDKYLKNYGQWIDETWDKLDKKLSKVAVKSREKIPYTTVDGVHDNRGETDPSWWTNGFWGALMWIMYIGTKNDVYKDTAVRAEELLDAAFDKFDGLHHDVGFMWNISSGTNYRLFGDKEAKKRWDYANALLASRFNAEGGFVRAWPSWGENADNTGVTIIDCMMNIPMLYRASVLAKDDRFKFIAETHARMTMRDHIRPDGSVHHIVRHDPHTGDVVENIAGQGYAVGSSWSRGQAWAVYGFVLSYLHTQNEEYLDVAKKVAHYFIANVAATDYLPLVDFRSPDEPVMYDSTAGACAACGLIEIARCVPEHEKKIYIDAAMKMLVAIEKEWCNWEENEDAVLMMGTEAYHKEDGHHIPIIYGDFFFAEALLKLKGNDFLIW
ncbi:MAG: glycoside hydrolase family 88 protein [Clostridia bacterium]|nr:glycoside hydrolase family 88 protein [Clostridia bacterium]